MKIIAKISWFYAVVVIVLSLSIMIITYPFLPRPKSRKLSAWLVRAFTFFRVDIKGEEDPDTQIFLINHQSDLDIAIMELISKRDFTWVAKKELFEIPFLSLVLKLPKDIAVDRESKASLIKLIKDAKEPIELGRVISMFPEGTRSSGAKM
ncbi:MAG: lysophospholipid acyltransferase family protein, partial [Sulfurimonas sp.]